LKIRKDVPLFGVRFQFTGATGKVKFEGSDRSEIDKDKEPLLTLVKVVPHCNLPNKWDFILVDKNKNCFD
jgi:hypothetical protein